MLGKRVLAIGNDILAPRNDVLACGNHILTPGSRVLMKERIKKSKLTPAAQRPGFRPEGTQRDLLSLVIVCNASEANPPGL